MGIININFIVIKFLYEHHFVVIVGIKGLKLLNFNFHSERVHNLKPMVSENNKKNKHIIVQL